MARGPITKPLSERNNSQLAPYPLFHPEQIMNPTKFEVEDTVQCPADRGNPGYTGCVTHVSTNQNTNIHGTPYYWVTVRTPDGKQHEVWPSHRISLVARAGGQ